MDIEEDWEQFWLCDDWKPIEDFPDYFVSRNGLIRGKMKRILKPNFCGNNRGYLVVQLCRDKKIFRKRVSVLVATAFISNPEHKPFVDHVNKDTLNNKVDNLRWATRSENLQNSKKRKNTSSRFKGVSRFKYHQNYWQASIRKNGKSIYLGTFSSDTAAAQAYDRAALKLFGEFASINFKR